MGDWTLFSNHGHVLICLARDREVRLRSVADDVGITERAVQKIVRELQEAGFITISKHGRRNRYQINTRKTLRHALEAKCPVGRLLQLFATSEKRAGKAPQEEISTADIASTAPSPVETASAPKQKPEPAPPEKRQTEAASIRKKSPVKEEKAAASKGPVDTRQQGSLF